MKNTFLQSSLNAFHQAMAVTIVFRLLTFTTAPSLAAASTYQPYEPVLDTTIVAQSLSIDSFVAATNTVRANAGVPTLQLSDTLSTAATAKLNDMAKNHYWGHVGPKNQQAWDFMDEAGYSYRYAGENLARGFVTAEGITEAWYASPTHRENLLQVKYTEVGFARGYITNEHGERVLITVQLFGSR